MRTSTTLAALGSAFGVDTAPGRHSWGRRTVTVRPSGDPVSLTAHLVTGDRPGPVLGLVSTTHGDEVYGIDLIRHLLADLSARPFRGAVLAVPVANVIAYESATRTTGQGLNTDVTNLNRAFPGRTDGWLTEMLARAIADHVVANVDALIDLHNGGAETVVDFVLHEAGQAPVDHRSAELSRAFATGLVFRTDGPAYPGTLAGCARAAGRACVVAEVGGTSLHDGGHRHRYLAGVRRVMAALDMLPEPPLETGVVELTRRTFVRATVGGYFEPVVGADTLGRTVPGGTLLGRVHCPQTLQLRADVRAPYPASTLMLLRCVQGRTTPGDFLYMIGDGDSAVAP